MGPVCCANVLSIHSDDMNNSIFCLIHFLCSSALVAIMCFCYGLFKVNTTIKPRGVTIGGAGVMTATGPCAAWPPSTLWPAAA